MTFNPIDQNQIIPEDKRKELYKLIHQFRMGLDRPKHNQNEIMQFAGSWSDIPEENFSDFCEEREQRRQATSSLFKSEPNLTFNREIIKSIRRNLCRSEKKGTPVYDIDLLIAGVAIANNLVLITHNQKHFGKIEILQLKDWTL